MAGSPSASHVEATPSWGWGSRGQLLACRLSHALALVVVLGLLLVVTDAPIVVWLVAQFAH
jgi:hypothetical protein